jgi:C-terminal processing protease CtpA/Prc
MNLRLSYYRATASNHLLHPKSHYVSSVSTISDTSLDTDIWKVYDITQKLSPAESFNFNGEIIILIDTNSISAADCFASTMKQLGLATLAGNSTGGWGNHYLSPVLFSLPNSGLCFRSDVELSYNIDDKPTSIYGTMPDVYLVQTPYPKILNKEELLKDEWVKWALKR